MLAIAPQGNALVLRNATPACIPATPISYQPRILVVVPGHGIPERSHVVQANLRRIAAQRVCATCLMFVYNNKLSNNTLAERFPTCRFTRQEGFWMHHLRAVPAVDVNAHDFVLLMIDGVEMNPDVDLYVLSRIMEANCLSLAGPACGSCKSKQQIRPVHTQPSYAVGRRVDYLDPQIQMYTPGAFLCLQRLVDHVGLGIDPTGWSVSALSTSFCASRVGIVDAMTVEKIYSKSSYDWVEAERTAEQARQSAIHRMPGLEVAKMKMVYNALRPPLLEQLAAASPGPEPHLPLLDVILIRPSLVTAEQSATMRALRWRLRLHSVRPLP